MAGGLSLSTGVEVFPCLHCGETINTSLERCDFCGLAVDYEGAQRAAAALSVINQACNDASYLKIMGSMSGTFFLLRFVPFIGFIGVVGFWFLEIAIPVMTIRWWIKFGAIKTADVEFSSSKRTAIVVSAVVMLFWVLVLTRVLRV